MDDKLIREINEKTSIVDLVGEFVSLSKAGKNYKGLCPFHDDKNPSFSVSPEKNIAKCMSCGEGGAPINFYRKIKNISFEEAATELALRAGIQVAQKNVRKDPHESLYQLMKEAAQFYQFNLRSSQQGQVAYQYLLKRQLSDSLIQYFKIGYAPLFGDALYQLLKDKGYNTSDMINLGLVKQKDDGTYHDLFSDRIIFPILDHQGHVVGFSGRTLSKTESAKYVNSPETVIFKKGQLLYHYFDALPEIRKEKHVILVEGFFDVMSATLAGLHQTVATMGTALTLSQAKLIKSVAPSVIIAYDGDKAGIQASFQAIPILEKAGLKVEILSIPEKMDPDDFVRSYGPEAFEALFGEYLKDAYQFRYDFFKTGKNLKNANDIQDFKKQVMGMLSGADQGVKAVYMNQLATDLGITLDQLRPEPTPKAVQIKPKPKHMLNKYEKAERYLIFEMMRSKTVSEKVMRTLKSTDFSHHLAAMIRIDIERYYHNHDVFDLDHFLNQISEVNREYVQHELLQDAYYINQLLSTDQRLEEYMILVRDANRIRRSDYLKAEIEKDIDMAAKRGYLEELNTLNKLMKTKPRREPWN